MACTMNLAVSTTEPRLVITRALQTPRLSFPLVRSILCRQQERICGSVVNGVIERMLLIYPRESSIEKPDQRPTPSRKSFRLK